MPIFNRITYSPVEASEAYAVFDSSDGSFTFFRDTPGKYTDGQVSGTKTYYTGFEDITGTPTPSWCTSDRSSQKNTIRTVTFKDKIQPKTCYRWFIGADSLTSITRLYKLDTENATNISRMFDNCTSLTSLDLSSFNTAKVTDMGRMFENCTSLTSLDVSSFDTENVTNMDGMFYGCNALTNLDLSSFNTANVTDISDMFSGCTSLTSLDVSSFNTSKVKNMNSMFFYCSGLTSLDVSSFDTENVTNMGGMFYNCNALTSLDLSSFNTAKVTNMIGMFNSCTSLTNLNLSSFNTANVTDMRYMFLYCTSLTSLDVSSFNTANATNTNGMFQNCTSLTSLDVSSFNTAKVTDMGYMFKECSKLKTIYASSLFTTDAVSSSTDMFYNNTSLVGGAGTTYDANHIDKAYARIDGGTSNRGYFTAKQAYAVYDSGDQSMTFFRDTPGKYTDGQVSGTKTYYTGFEDITGETAPSWFDLSNYEQKNTIKTVAFKDKIKPKTCYWWFKNAGSLVSITGLDKLDTENVTNMGYMFYNCSSLTSLDLSNFNTKNVTKMGEMFDSCSSLTSLDVSSFNTAAVTDMSYMFSGCTSLTSLDVSSFNTENVTYMSSMFSNCIKFTSLDLSSFNTAKVTNMDHMFYNCSSLTSLDLSSFNTENVTYMSSMFEYCSSLTSLDVSSFNTAKVTDMGRMFYNCSSLTSLDLSSFNTENVTYMSSMFEYCSSLASLDLSSFNTAAVTSMSYMFNRCSRLKTIYASSLFTINIGLYSYDMFNGCSSLVGGAGTKYNSSHDDADYARIDGGTSNPGYFTAKVAPAGFPKIVTWASGTDEEIAKMIEAADAGKISLGDYWKVGDTRKVNLAAMSATGVGESHDAQQVEMVLMNKGGKTLSNGKTCSFIVGLKDCLKEAGYMNSSDTNAGSWRDSKRRAWCNGTFRNAIPSTLRGVFKQHTNTTGDQANKSTLIDTIDYFALPAEKEIFGDGYGYAGKGYSVDAEANSSKLTQFDWYKTSANRIKKVNGSASIWWERSPGYGYPNDFCRVDSDGTANSYDASRSYGLAPFGCI